MTARHVALSSGSGCDTTSAEQEPIKQGGSPFGTVVDESYEHESAFISPDSDETITNKIVDETKEIVGWKNKNGISNLASFFGATIDFRGTTSCQLSGKINSYDNSLVCDSSNIVLTELVHSNLSTSPGDSGGIIYHRKDKGAFIAHLHSGKRSNGKEFGAAAYAINNQEGYTFGN